MSTPADIRRDTLCTDQSTWFVLLIAQLLALVIALLGGPDGFWVTLALASVFCYWVGFAGLWSLCRLQRAGLDGRRRQHWVLYWLTLCLLGGVGLLGGHALYGWLFPETRTLEPVPLFMQLLAVLIFAGLLLRYWYLQTALTLRQQARVLAELDALQARLNPHFLFNALNAVAALIRQDPARAESAVEYLSDLMRASLKSHQTLVTLEQELELTRAYIWLEQARFGDRLHIEWDIDERLLGESVPILSLQPLVENAVKHGIAPRPEGGVIEITVNAAVKVWMIRVKNALPERPAPSGNRFALDTLEARGKVLLGDRFALSTRLDNGYFLAQMTLKF